MNSPSRQWFISDTHFCSHRSEHIEAFERLANEIQSGDTLLLLGDIFEIWVSDDLASESDRRVEHVLAALHDRGVKVFFMHGNRDFMVGRAFAKRTGCILIKDPSIWTLPNGQSCLLTHGDWFCTDDKRYRRFRYIMRNAVFQFIFRNLPKARRRRIANGIRQRSIESHADNGNQSYDANNALIEHYFHKYSPVNTIIMGHTHLPNLHQNGDKTRLVLGDWRDTLWYGLTDPYGKFELIEASLDLTERRCRHQF